MKQSNALLAAWLVLIAVLAGTLVYFTFSAQDAAPPVADPPVVKVEPKAGPKEAEPKVPKGQPRKKTTTERAPDRPLSITGTVQDRDGKPVAGAQIALFRQTTKPGQPESAPDVEELRLVSQIVYVSPDSWELPRRLENWTQGAESQPEEAGGELVSTESKEDGTFSISLEQRMGPGPFRLTAQKDQIGSATVSGVDPRQSVLVQLGQAAAFSGVVITEVDSVPVEGARVKLEGGSRTYGGVTGAGGKFAIEDVSPGLYQLSVAAKGRTPLFETGFRIAPNDPNPYTLRMPRGTTLRVKCTLDSAGDMSDVGGPGKTGDPVPNAQVVAFSESTFAYVIGKTNAEGVVEFPGLPAGEYILNGLAPKFVSLQEEQVGIDRNELTKEASILFEPAVETAIEVVDPDGRPVAGMDFYTLNSDETYDALRSVKAGTTDSEGRFKFPFEFDGPRSAIYGFKQGYAFVRAAPDSHDSGDPIRLVAAKPLRVRGLVKTEDGHAIPDAIVEISVMPEQDEAAFDDMRLEVRTDKDGRYDFPFLPRASGISLIALTPDGDSSDPEDLDVSDGKSDYDLDLVLGSVASMPVKAPAPRAPPPDKNETEKK